MQDRSPAPSRVEEQFPGLREYLRERFGPEAGAATWERLGVGRQQVKEGGYGTPYLVRWPSAGGWRRLPVSYANFLIANAAVLVPTFNDPRDRIALGILGELFRDRPVVGIHAMDLVWGLGTLHCLTRQQPAA